MISVLVLATATTFAQSDPGRVGSFSFPETEPPGFDCVYRRLSPEDRAISQQRVVTRLEAASRDDKARPNDPTEKDRKKRSIAVSSQCQEEFNFDDWQMNDWISKYTNALNTAEVTSRYLDRSDASRIADAVRSLSPADLATLREKHPKNADAVFIRLMQAVFKTDKALDRRLLIYSGAYLTSLIAIRDTRLRWADWRRAEDAKAQAKAAAQAR